MTRYWIWLSKVIGTNSSKFFRIIKEFGSAKGFFEASPDVRINAVGLTPAEQRRMKSVGMDEILEIIKLCEQNNIQIIPFDSPKYPDRLRNIFDPPPVIYCRGELPDFDDEVVLAVVGPRKPSEFGRKAAFSLSRRLADSGCIIISGGALGVDTCAHTGALSCNGKTVAVLGCGICSDYLKQNRALREKIAVNGCLVSEFPPMTPARPELFPIRNRIIAALSLGTIVIEASLKSGALITANLANEQGRDVFVVPGSPSLPQYEGSNRLLFDGAKPVLSALDVLNEYVDLYPNKINLQKAVKTKSVLDDGDRVKNNAKSHTVKESITAIDKTVDASIQKLSDHAKTVYACFNGDPLNADHIVAKTDLKIGDVFSSLFELELSGLIKAIPGGRYVLDNQNTTQG
ncbi:MAG: DNA-processing protein DprA [bacterium]|nr:DNA-processing protein DprA [bacterium]